jgi:hypothetical protein
MSQSPDCFFFDLPNSFSGQAEVLSDLFEGHFGAGDAEKHADDICFPFGECGK